MAESLSSKGAIKSPQGQPEDKAQPESPSATDGDSAADALTAEEEERRQEKARAAVMATRPFAEQIADITTNLKMKSQTAPAVRHLLHLLDTRSSEIASYPNIVDLLGRAISEGPAMPAAGAAMAVLARMSLVPETRARVRAEAALLPVIRYLALADPDKAVNAEPAALLLLNVASDRLGRRALLAAHAVEALLALLPKVRQHDSALNGYVAGALLAFATDASRTCQQRLVDAGGIEVACRSLADRPRSDTGRSTLRIRLLLAELCRASKGWEARVYQGAADVSPSALLAAQQAAGAPASVAAAASG